MIVALALWGTYEHRSEISSAGSMLSRVHVAWLLVAIWAELASMAVFARLQRWLLRAGGVEVPFVPMVEITLAGNALSTTLPGGAAWSATWVFEQLRRRGAQKTLAGWVILVAGALSSFAIFVILAVGAWVAGSRGPVSSLRWLAAALAAIPLVVAAAYVLARSSHRVRQLLGSSWSAVTRHLALARALDRLVRKTIKSLGLVHPGVLGWAEAFGLAMANWLCDCLCLLACTEALGVPVHWSALLVIYGLTQVAASLPITPGGIGVVEGSLTALLIAYGTRPTDAVAVVLLYRIVSFWGLAPIGWTAWAGLELALRHGLRHAAHPWADHEHGPAPAPEHPALAPDRVVPPSPCMGCDEGAGANGGNSGSDDGLARAGRAPADSGPPGSSP